MPKPPPGSLANTLHPLMPTYGYAFLEGSGTSVANISPGKAAGTFIGTPVWSTNANGAVVQFPTIDDAIAMEGMDTVMPSTSVMSIFVRWKKNDVTNRSAALLGNNDLTNPRMWLSVPYVDGTLYFDFSNASTGRLTKSGLAYTGSSWAFITDQTANAGAGRMEIWQNGVLQASKDTSVTRVTNTGTMRINYASASTKGDIAEIEALYIYSGRRLSAADVASLTANPYQMFGTRRNNIAAIRNSQMHTNLRRGMKTGRRK